MKLRQVLQNIPPDDRMALASFYNIKLPAGRVPDAMLIEALFRHLTTPDVINRILSELNDEERTALKVLIAEGGRMPAPLFERDFGNLRSLFYFFYTYGSLQTSSSSEQQSVAQKLYRRGLIFVEQGAIGTRQASIVGIPDEILALLPKVKKPSFQELLVAAPQPVYPIERGDLVHDIGMFICYVKREVVRPVHVNRLGKRDISRLNEDLSLRSDTVGIRSESEVPWIDFVHHMAQLLGLVKVQSSTIAITDKAMDWLRQSHDRQMWDVWHGYTKDSSWDELTATIRGYAESARPSTQLVLSARSRLLEMMKLCPPGRWFTVESLEDAIKTHASGFLRMPPREDPYAHYWESYYGGWNAVERPYIRFVLATSLNWLGVVDVGASSEDGQDLAFRITQSGAILLGSSVGKIPEPASRPIVVQANFEIIVPAEASPAVVFRVQQVAELRQRDRASIYALTPNSIWRHLQDGGDIERTISFLEKTSGRELPQNVAYSLREWATKHGHLTIDQVILLSASSESLLSEVRANKKIGLQIKEILSPQAVTLADQDIAALIGKLRKLGYWPRLGANLAATDRTAEAAGSNMTIKTTHLLRLLAAATVLLHIAEREGWTPPVSESLVRELSWRLTPALVKQLERLTNEAIAGYGASQDDMPSDDGADGSL